MSSRKFETFTANNVEFTVYEPTIAEYKEAAKVKNEAFVEALNAKAPLRAQINTLLRKRGEWDDERESQYNDLTKSLLEKERQLKQGGIKLSQGRAIALEMRTIRSKLKDLLVDRSTLDNMTAEGQADNAHFNALVAACLVYNTPEERYFKSYDDYLLSTDGLISNTAAQKLANLMYTIGDSAEKNLPENKFLKKWTFIDDNLHLINKEGKLIDVENRLVDKDGRYISDDGTYVDKFGNKVDKAGEYIIDIKPFLDDVTGEELVEEKVENKLVEEINKVES